MKLNRLLVFSVFIFSAFLFSACGKDYSDFCSQAEDYLSNSNFQGTVLVAQGKKIIYEKGFGLEDEKAKKSKENSPETIYEIGSISKQMTAACVMQLVEKNKISLDDTIDLFFPDFQYGNQITVRMLLNMRSGLLDHINGPEEFFGNKLAKQVSKKELSGKAVERDLVLKSLYKAELLCTPDSTYFYSNTNYYLLALIVEKISGEDYEEYFDRNILKKAEMHSSNIEFQNTTARGYFNKKYYSIPHNMALGCGDVNSTARDLLKWNVALSGGKIISKKAFAQMIDSDSYGFGVYRSPNSILHSGATYVFNSYNEFFLDDKISLIVLCNKPQSSLNATIVAGKLKKMLFPEPKNPQE